MKVLVACEESQAVCMAFRLLGHEAYSCDLLDCSGGHPEWHIVQDCLPLLNGRCNFKTLDGVCHSIVDRWDMIIAFPPCTDLAGSGARHFERKRSNGKQRDSIEFFSQFFFADCDKIAIENPVGIISGEYIIKWFPDLADRFDLPRKPTQIIQPYEFGHSARKATCLWLKNLPCLIPTNIVSPDLITYIHSDGKSYTYSRHMYQGFSIEDRAKIRSKTFTGVAYAMANQWGGVF